jgi:hypothetical protein
VARRKKSAQDDEHRDQRRREDRQASPRRRTFDSADCSYPGRVPTAPCPDCGLTCPDHAPCRGGARPGARSRRSPGAPPSTSRARSWPGRSLDAPRLPARLAGGAVLACGRAARAAGGAARVPRGERPSTLPLRGARPTVDAPASGGARSCSYVVPSARGRGAERFRGACLRLLFCLSPLCLRSRLAASVRGRPGGSGFSPVHRCRLLLLCPAALKPPP